MKSLKKTFGKSFRPVLSTWAALAVAVLLPAFVALADCYFSDLNNGYCGPNGSTGGFLPGSPCTITTCPVKWGCQSGYQYLQCYTTPNTATCTTTSGVVSYVFFPFGWFCLPLAPGPSVGPFPCTIQYSLGC